MRSNCVVNYHDADTPNQKGSYCGIGRPAAGWKMALMWMFL